MTRGALRPLPSCVTVDVDPAGRTVVSIALASPIVEERRAVYVAALVLDLVMAGELVAAGSLPELCSDGLELVI